MFSCCTRGFCPSCHAKRREERGEWMRETLLLDVPHRQIVFAQLFPRHKDKIYAILERRMDCLSEWAKKRNLPRVTTEGWSTVMYEDMTYCGFGGEWDWFKETAGMAVKLAIKKGWQGISAQATSANPISKGCGTILPVTNG